jgi:hypothetical protein
MAMGADAPGALDATDEDMAGDKKSARAIAKISKDGRISLLALFYRLCKTDLF